jgi:quercetin dioxygenase-like cupin family protein
MKKSLATRHGELTAERLLRDRPGLARQIGFSKSKHIHNARVLCTLTFLIWSSGLSVPQCVAADPAAKEHKPVIMLPSDMQWSDSPALPVGVKVSILYGDMKKAEPIGFRVKLPAGAIIAPHTHSVHERVTVISGAFAMGEGEKFNKEALKEMPVGSMAIFPRGCPMFGFAREETVIQVNAEGPWGITYVNPADDPRNK